MATSQVLADQVEIVKRQWGESIGRSYIRFANSDYLSLRSKANKSFSMGFLMNAAKVRPSEKKEKENQKPSSASSLIRQITVEELSVLVGLVIRQLVVSICWWCLASRARE